MIIGDKSIFAIEYELVESANGPSCGHFRFWASTYPIGDYEEQLNLRTCLNWLKDFLLYSDDRYEPSLDNKSKEEVFKLIFDSSTVTIPEGTTLSNVLADKTLFQDTEPSKYENARRRFILDQIGMASFSDKYNVVLIERKDGIQRLIWRNLKDLQLHEALLPRRYFEEVALLFINDFNSEN